MADASQVSSFMPCPLHRLADPHAGGTHALCRSNVVLTSELGYDTALPVTEQAIHNKVTMLPVQSKMGRAATGLGVRELAAAAGVSPDTVARLERGEKLAPRTIAAIRAALETAGVEFIEENGGGPGVRLRKRGGPEAQ
jgi:DNA-binding XRE family transcriptional regulator